MVIIDFVVCNRSRKSHAVFFSLLVKVNFSLVEMNLEGLKVISSVVIAD